MNRVARLLGASALVGFALVAAAEDAPWGKAQANDTQYSPQKVVYDVAARSEQVFARVLDRVSYLSKVYQADPFDSSIVLVLHGDEINFFAREHFARYDELMRRAQSLTVGTTIEFRMCRIAAQAHGYEPEDIHGFVTMVPMADAEIVRLQAEEGYAYMQ